MVSPQQPIPWRQRADLQIVPLEFEGRSAWGVKDPVTLGYYELRDEACFVLKCLDGRATFAGVCDQFAKRFLPRRLSIEELDQFLRQLIGQGLVSAEGPGYGRALVQRADVSRRRWWWMQLGNLLAIRFRGFDPDRLLTWMLSGLGWLFSPVAVAGGMALIFSALILVMVQFDELIRRLPETQALLTPSNLILLAVVLGCVKVLHELGHGLTCKWCGGECRELGVLLLVGVPTLYCNVTDIWMVKDKWKRIAVDAAGMWVEIILASTCTLLWWFSQPGLFHTVCFNLMLVCGVSTLIFNGNPLLRYDGYFVLADWLEIPNLQQQSQQAIRGRLARFYCGIADEPDADSTPAREWGLIAYGIASSAYRVMVTFVILWALHRWLKPLGFGVLVPLLAIPTLGAMILNPVLAVTRFVRSPVQSTAIRWGRFVILGGATLVLLGWLITMPLPHRVTAAALLDDSDARRVYVTSPGTLIDGVQTGQSVTEGTPLARLRDPRLELELVELQGRVNQQQIRVEQLDRRRVSEPNMAQFIPAARESLRDLEDQLRQRQLAAEQLVVKAPCGGIVLPAPARQASAGATLLGQWTGHPLEERNRGCLLTAGTPICLIGDPAGTEALLLVSQDDVSLIRVGQSVKLTWNEWQGDLVTGHITELAAADLNAISFSTLYRLDIPLRQTVDGRSHPVGTWYQARVHLAPTEAILPRNSSGTARIVVAPLSLAHRTLRWLDQTFALSR